MVSSFLLLVFIVRLVSSKRPTTGHTPVCSIYSDKATSFAGRGVVVRSYDNPGAARMGNHLFMYAAAFGIAHINNFELYHFPWPERREPNIFELFNIPPEITRWKSEDLLPLGETRGTALRFDPACLSLPPQRYQVNGFRQSFKYFNNIQIEADLRKSLSFRNLTLVNSARVFLDNINSTIQRGSDSVARHSRQIVGIHIRYGMSNARGFGGCIPNAEFYQRAIEYYRRKFTTVAFVYASEPLGLEWFKREVIARDTFKGYDMFPITNDATETFAILSLCDASVFSFGSFGWFAAWIGGGQVLYSDHLNHQPSNCEVVSMSGIHDFIPPTWVPV